MNPYTYILVRTDLPPIQMAVQACHAALQAGFTFEEPGTVSSIVLLGVASETELRDAAATLELHNVDHHLFYEPDFGPMGYSALASRPIELKRERKLFANYSKLDLFEQKGKHYA